MKIRHYTQTAPDPAGESGAEGVSVRWVISRQDGAGNFSMRVITIEPGGHTPSHRHPWEHEVFVLSGAGLVAQGEGEHPCSPGDVIFIVPGEPHQFRNCSDRALEFICLIPNRD
jgi:quercetin dioxygenase-like cupin family protein